MLSKNESCPACGVAFTIEPPKLGVTTRDSIGVLHRYHRECYQKQHLEWMAAVKRMTPEEKEAYFIKETNHDKRTSTKPASKKSKSVGGRKSSKVASKKVYKAAKWK